MLYGARCKSSGWLNELSTTYEKCIQECIEYAADLPYLKRIVALERYSQEMREDSQKALIFMEMATLLSEAGVAALGTRDFVTALQAFHDCYRPIQECKRVTRGSGDVFKEICVIEADVGFHMATAEAIQAIKIGDKVLKEALLGDETLCMDKVYDSMDWYKKAIICTREVEVEMEAMAASRLGKLFDGVLKIKSKAREYFKTCLQLAASLTPRHFANEDWYKTASETLQRYQTEAVDNDEAIRQAEREQYINELEDELDDLREANVGSGAGGFLKHIYKIYPPKNPQHVLNEDDLLDTTNMKKLLLKALSHYHPDKQDKEKFGRKWVVLCEEITKMLNGRYEAYKFV